MTQKSTVYTRTGDTGTTSLTGGTRVQKNDARLEAYGTVDELNSWLGLLHSSDAATDQIRATLLKAMHHLFDIGAILATEPSSTWQPAPFPIQAVEELEKDIDLLDSTLPRHNRFILPAGAPDSARAQIARTVARRAERRIITLTQTSVDVDPAVLKYINRLSDYLFILARALNILNRQQEIFWDKNC